RLIRFSGNLRNDFLVNNLKLQFCEPFVSLEKELRKRKIMTIQDVGDFLETKFLQKKKLISSDKEAIGAAMGEWLGILRIANVENKKITFAKGEVKTSGLLYYPEMSNLLRSSTYDFLVENFNTPHNIIDEPYELLEKTNKTADDNDKGDFFELFIGSIFRRLGFSPRLRDGPKERKINLTFQRKGGGDVGLFCHFPFQANDQILQGYAIASEAKAGENAIGSKAVGQARNLSTKIKEVYPKYLVHTIVVSQSKCGYDSSGREQAPPEVIHITAKSLLCLLNMQEKQLENDCPLITPFSVSLLFEELIKKQELEPEPASVVEIMEEILERDK
ncbi:hypothetical protein MUO79_05285, partial [Candidatus Bathyarchaeota archaeon]|nr:hypothetical protein [Candidatus Bathyarchaeota archaeon]